MGYDVLMPLSHSEIDGLGGLGTTIVYTLNTAIIMGVNDIIVETGSWIEMHLSENNSQPSQLI